jgi:mRNA interferase RelE/StbE
MPPGVKKLSGSSSLYRARQGDYRIIYTIEHSEKIIKIVLVRHRKSAYRSL